MPGVGDVLADAVGGGFRHLGLQGVQVLDFGFALFVGQGGVSHSLVDGRSLLVQLSELLADGLVDIIVRRAGSAFAVLSELHLYFAVFQEEVHAPSLFRLALVGQVADFSRVLPAFERELSVFDDG